MMSFCFIAGIIFLIPATNSEDQGKDGTETLYQKPPATHDAHSHHDDLSKDTHVHTRETPELAREAKKNYLKRIEKKFRRINASF